METYLAYTIIVYLIGILFLGFILNRKVADEADFLVGGRQFNLWLSTFSLFATWFGAGTLIAATDEVAVIGLKATALEPYGAGFCLIFAGIFVAKPVWEMKLMTYADFFRNKFGTKVEAISVFINIPIYVGWIAVQIISLANILQVFFPIPLWILIISISMIAFILTSSGGMWSVSITDSVQLLVIIIGLIYLLIKILNVMPYGFEGLWGNIEQDQLVLIPAERAADLFNWLSVFSVAALGNITGQDLGQRMFSANSSKTAQRACFIAGFGYMSIGSIPVFLGLTAHQTLGEFSGSVIPLLIKQFLDPVTSVILTLTIISAVISTITSALLAPASMLSHNFLKNYFPRTSTLILCRYAVFVISLLSIITAFAGENVYSLLEDSYAIGFVGFFVPFTIGLYSKKLNQTACLVAMIVSTLIWSFEFIFGGSFPYSLVAVLAGYPTYFVCYFNLQGKYC